MRCRTQTTRKWHRLHHCLLYDARLLSRRKLRKPYHAVQAECGLNSGITVLSTVDNPRVQSYVTQGPTVGQRGTNGIKLCVCRTLLPRLHDQAGLTSCYMLAGRASSMFARSCKQGVNYPTPVSGVSVQVMVHTWPR